MVLLVPLLLLAACHDQASVSPELTDEQTGRNFLPIAIGHYWIYDVTDRKWDFNVAQVSKYQLRERVDTVYPAATGEPTFRIVRSRRADASSPWRDDSVMAVVLTPQLVRRTMANRTTIELLFPVAAGKSWNPNLFNDLDSTTRAYVAFDQSQTLPTGLTFARTVAVTNEGQDNLFYRREAVSQYARNVGRISRIRRSLDFCQFNDSINIRCSIGPGYIIRGNEREEYLLEYDVK
jgi:hypothetical protein